MQKVSFVQGSDTRIEGSGMAALLLHDALEFKSIAKSGQTLMLSFRIYPQEQAGIGYVSRMHAIQKFTI